jgi:hypothetical protein
LDSDKLACRCRVRMGQSIKTNRLNSSNGGQDRPVRKRRRILRESWLWVLFLLVLLFLVLMWIKPLVRSVIFYYVAASVCVCHGWHLLHCSQRQTVAPNDRWSREASHTHVASVVINQSIVAMIQLLYYSRGVVVALY